MKIPKVIIAGTHSGVGKTSVALCVMSGLTRMGLKVQAFKVGPDYIDPGYHAVATGWPSHNLDDWMMGRDAVNRLYESSVKGKDIAIIEGVMGLFDGFSSTDDQGSTANIAKILKAPVILVVDAGKMARSVAAIIKGYQTFDPDLNICGVILNRVGSEHHFHMLRESIAFYNAVPVLGCVMKDDLISIPERHLGLTTASENEELHNCLNQLSMYTALKDDALKIDLNKVLHVAKQNFQESGKSEILINESSDTFDTRVAYSLDRAFQFYYQANLDALERLGATLIPFSPLDDDQLPADIDGLYFGGGFPEVYAKELEMNERMRSSVREAIGLGLPTYAECGGLIYLTEAVKTSGGGLYQMAGVIPGHIAMTNRLQNFGYCENILIDDCLLGSKGDQFRGHEFHYSFWDREGINPAYRVDKKRRKSCRLEGYSEGNLLASYVHCHFLSNIKIAQNFLIHASNYSRLKQEAGTGNAIA